ncbi:MAG: 30S ribosomal protein S6e [Candidatus Bathyarchaeia archaeon]
MAKFKLIISDKSGKTQTVELEGPRAIPLLGRRIGEVIDGSIANLGGKKLLITGGTDKDGFPMRKDIQGGVKTKILLSSGAGFHPSEPGLRRRKTIRGNTITEDITTINLKLVEEEAQPQARG